MDSSLALDDRSIREVFLSLLTNSVDPVLLSRPDGTILHANPAACEALGRSQDEIVALGRAGLVVDTPEFRRLLQVRATKSRVSGEILFRRPDGTAFPAEFSATVVAASSGDPVTLIIFRDISARRKLERDLRENEALFRTVFHLLPDAVSITDVETGTFVSVNEGAASVTGWAPEEMIGRPAASLGLWHERDREAFVARIRADGILRDFPTRLGRKDGSVIDVLLSARPVTVGGRTLLLTVTRDVTVAQRAASAVRASEERMKEAERIAHVGHWDIDPRTGAVIGSEEVYRIFEIERGTPITFDRCVAAIHPDDRKIVLEGFERSLAEHTVHDVTHRLVMPDGRVKVVHVVSETTCAPDGTPVRSLGTVQDVTDVHSLQAKLALSSRLAAMGTLVAGVAHEISNPLSAALSSIGFARDVVDQALGVLRSGGVPDARLATDLEQAVEALGDGEDAGKRISRIIRDMASLSRPEPARTRVRVPEVVREALRWLPSSVSRFDGIQVVDEGAPDVLAAPVQLQQVFVNLVSNAVRSMPSGKKGTIVIRIGRGPSGTACIEVRDDGAGMEAAVVERVFDPFFTTRLVGQGMGLGLPICHSVVSAHGGTIRAESESGKGSTFRIELPAAPAAA
jgi:PAS domain S-box-containing protein